MIVVVDQEFLIIPSLTHCVRWCNPVVWMQGGYGAIVNNPLGGGRGGGLDEWWNYRNVNGRRRPVTVSLKIWFAPQNVNKKLHICYICTHSIVASNFTTSKSTKTSRRVFFFEFTIRVLVLIRGIPIPPFLLSHPVLFFLAIPFPSQVLSSTREIHLAERCELLQWARVELDRQVDCATS